MIAMNQPSYSIETLLRGVKSLLNSLPTEDEKQEILQSLGEISKFLEELQSLVMQVPTMESSRELSEGLSRLDALTRQVHQDTGLRKALGLRGSIARGKGRAATSAVADEQVSELMEVVANSDSSKIESLIAQEPLAVLRKLADRLNLRVPSKERKQDMIRRLVIHVENQRGYATLRGENFHSGADSPLLSELPDC